MNFERYKKYIVVDGGNRPMTFDGEQFCFAQTHRARQPFALKTYTHHKAMELIRKCVEYRTKNGFSVGEYYLIPMEDSKVKTRKERTMK